MSTRHRQGQGTLGAEWGTGRSERAEGAALLELIAFVLAAGASLGASALFVVRLERLAHRLGLTEAALGLLAALGADAPEITSSVTALAHHEHTVGIGVAIGSNLFNLAALIGLASLVSRRLDLDRRLGVLELVPSVALATLAAAALDRLIAPGALLVLVVVVLSPYVVIAFLGEERIRLRLGRSAQLIEAALEEEERELAEVTAPGSATNADLLQAVGLLILVIGASVVMERAASSFGGRFHLSSLVVGGVVLAAVTSIPNAVAALYLARRRRPAALLAEVSNSNAFNVVFGFALPAVVAGYGVEMTGDRVIGLSYLLLTVVAYAALVWKGGFRRATGVVVLLGYVAFLACAVAIT